MAGSPAKAAVRKLFAPFVYFLGKNNTIQMVQLMAQAFRELAFAGHHELPAVFIKCAYRYNAWTGCFAIAVWKTETAFGTALEPLGFDDNRIHKFFKAVSHIDHYKPFQLSLIHILRVVASGKKLVKSIEIKEEVVDPDDVEMLQDLVIAAVNEALAKADEMMQTEMGKITGGMNLGGLL